jgi:hypothetical protein
MMLLELDDIIRLRKKHPCGSDEWQVIQVGLDIRIRCLGCQRQIVLDRLVLERKIKTVISRISPDNEIDKAKSSK